MIPGDIVKITDSTTGKIKFIRLTQRPTKMKALCKDFDDDEFLLNGIKMKKNLNYSNKSSREKPFVVKESEVEIVGRIDY